MVAVTTFSTSTVTILFDLDRLLDLDGNRLLTSTVICTSFSTTCVTTRSTGTSLSTTTTFSSVTTCGSQAARIGSVAIAPRPVRNDRRANLCAMILLNI